MENPNPKTPSNQLRFLVFGAGAIGTYIGGSLALRGYPVVFLEKPEAIQTISTRGIHLDLGGKVFEIDSPTLYASISDALQDGPYDAAIFAIKSFDTHAALQEIKPLQGKMPPLICLQNGVENELLMSEILGADCVIPGTVTTAIGRRKSGEIVLERLRGIGIASGYPLSKEIVTAFSESGLNAKLIHSAPAMKWSKLLTNLFANASSAILKMTPAEIISDRGLFTLEIAQIREALQIMDAMGISVINLPGTQVRLLAFAVRRLPTYISQPLLIRAIGAGRGAKMPSLYIDLYGGRGKSEVDFLNGAVVRFGEKLGIPTPTNLLLSQTLASIVRGDIPIDKFNNNPDRLIQIWLDNT